MQLQRTTIRLPIQLKKQAHQKALDIDVSFQTLLTQALQQYLEKQSQKKIRKIVFHTHDLGVELDNLTREDIYAD